MAVVELTVEQKSALVAAIKSAELNTSGEIRVHLEKRCKIDVLDRATAVFELLNMHKTSLRNGVLIYVATEDRQMAIIGDVGINAKVSKGFWDETKELILKSFKAGNIVGGLVDGIHHAGEQLQQHFPYQKDDKNELNDEISLGS